MATLAQVDLQKLWEQVVSSISTPQYGAFLSRTKPLGLLAGEGDDGSNLLLSAPDLFTKDVLETRLRSLLTDELTNLLGEKINIAVTVTSESKEEVGESNFSSEVDYLDPVVDNKGGTGRNSTSLNTNESAQLNPRYIFETFVIGASNRFAHAAAVAVAEAPAKAYAKELYGSTRVRYVSSEEFTNDFINSIRDDKASVFQKRYRDLDILLVDDIQFLENKERTQEEFFHTFNTLYNANKQIVISSDRPPKQLTTLEDRLRSRFEWGLITDIQPPELETRIAILRKKAAQDKLNAPDDVLEYIASKISTNIRELEGALIRVTAFASLNRQGVDLSLAEIVLKDLIPEEGGPEITGPT
ncbi:MAG: chromosomal replication initiation protein, partial [Alphaproteobacteria bacterium]|nr:chromosomal replication initiation protein [Candidatus Fonsibacter sp. PEL55]